MWNDLKKTIIVNTERKLIKINLFSRIGQNRSIVVDQVFYTTILMAISTDTSSRFLEDKRKIQQKMDR